MPDIENVPGLEALKKELEGLAGSSATVIPKLSDAMQDMLTAAGYADETLLASSLASLQSCLVEVTRDIIDRELKTAQAVKDSIRNGWKKHVDGRVGEDFDELKNVIESFLDERVASMTRIQEKLVRPLAAKNCRVENAVQLEEGIRELRQFRADLLRDWPISSKRPSPLDRKAVAEAREAIAGGYKGVPKSGLVWGSDPTRQNNG